MVTTVSEQIAVTAHPRVVFSRRARYSRLLRCAAAVTAVAVLAGCSNANDTTRVEGVGLGALLGAGLGAAIGGKQGALIGAGVGAAVGLAGAEYVNYKRREYANNEDRLAAEQSIALSNLKAMQDYNNQLTARINALDGRIAALHQAMENGQAVNAQLVSTRNQAASEEQHARAKLVEVNNALAESERNLALARAAATPSDSAGLARLQSDVAAQEQERDRLQAGVDRLKAAEERL